MSNTEGENILDESADIRIGEGFGTISDLLSGPGGMFVMSLTQGKLYRITQQPMPEMQAMLRSGFVLLPEPGAAAGVVLGLFLATRRRGRRVS